MQKNAFMFVLSTQPPCTCKASYNNVYIGRLGTCVLFTQKQCMCVCVYVYVYISTEEIY